MRRLPLPLAAFAATLFLALGLTQSSTPAHAAAGTDTDPGVLQSSTVVINETTPYGPFGSFLELRNASAGTVDLGGWNLYLCDSNTATLVHTFSAGRALAPGEFLVLSGSNNPTPEGAALTSPNGWEDGVGISVNPCTTGDPAPVCNWNAGESVSRDAMSTNTFDNATDFTCQPATPGY